VSDFSIVTDIVAAPEKVWAVISDVERWPEWTPSVRSIKRYDAGPLAIGSRARIEQPKLRPADWEVTRLEKDRGFDWVTRTPGLVVTGGHWIEPVPAGSRVTISIRLAGLLSPLVAWLARKLNASYLDLEATGLKTRCEDATRS
jgi:hypothetical protein